MSNKKLFSVVIFIVIILGIVWYSFDRKKETQPVQTQNNQVKNMKTDAETITTPPLVVVGLVSKVEGQKITIKVGAEETQKIIIISEKTKLLKVLTKTPPLENIPATVDDIQVKKRLIVSYEESSDLGIIAKTVNVLSF